MKFHTTWKFHCDTLQFICFKNDFFCSLAVAIYISCHIRIWKRHCHIRNIWLRNTIIIKFFRKILCSSICTRKSIWTAIRIWRSKMYQNKSGSCTQVSIAIFFCKKSIIARSLCAIVTYFSQCFTISNLIDCICSCARSRFGRLYTISCGGHITEFYGILIRQISSITIIRISVFGTSCHWNLLWTSCISCCRHKCHCFTRLHLIQVNSFIFCLIHYFWNSQTRFFICCYFLSICKISYNFFWPVRISIFIRITGIFCFTGISFTSCIFRRTLCLCFCFRLFYRNVSAYSVSWVTADWLYCIDSFVGIRCMCVKICTGFTLCFME